MVQAWTCTFKVVVSITKRSEAFVNLKAGLLGLLPLFHEQTSYRSLLPCR